jgi:hypothetical protein
MLCEGRFFRKPRLALLAQKIFSGIMRKNPSCKLCFIAAFLTECLPVARHICPHGNNESIGLKLRKVFFTAMRLSIHGLPLTILFLTIVTSGYGQRAGEKPAAANALSRDQGIIKTPENIVADGVPAIPASLARTVKPYTGIYGLPLAGWDSTKREVLLKGLSSATWISKIEAPGSAPKITTYIQTSGIYDVYYQPQASYIAYARGDHSVI